MGRLSRQNIRALFARADRATTAAAKGRLLEDLIADVFVTIPGIEIVARNSLNRFGTEEVDVALFNGQHKRGVPFLPYLILVESKNWSRPVGSQEVAYFAQRLAHKSCEYGVLVAASGITGDPGDLTRAHYEIALALASGRRIIVITRDELEALRSSSDLILLIKRKLCQLSVGGPL